MLSYIRKRLSLKLLLPLCLIIVIGIGGLVWMVTNSTFSLAKESAMQTAQGQALAGARALTVFIQDQVVMAEVLAQQPSMMSAVKGSPWMAIAACSKIVKSNSNLWGLAVFDAKGKVVAAANADKSKLKGMDFSGNKFVQRVLSGDADKVVEESVYKPEYANSRIFGISVPIRSTMSGKVVGGIVLFASWDAYVHQFVESAKVGKGGYGFVLDGNGRFIHHPDPTLDLTDSSKLGFAEKLAAHKQGVAEYEWLGKEKMMAFAVEPLSGWRICMGTEVEDIASTAHDQALLMEAVGGILIVAVMVLVLFLLRIFVFKPIRATMAMADATARGTWSSCTNPTRTVTKSHAYRRL